MSSCNTIIDQYQSVDANLKIIEKYEELMQASLGEQSIYMRAKDTFKVIFDDLQVSEPEKAKIAAEHVMTMTTQLSSSAMSNALSWAKEERDGAYTLAKVKAEVEVALAQKELVAEQICKMQKDTELACAQILATVSGSFRENGIPIGYEADGCRPTGLDDTGLKYHQTQQVKAATYQAFSDAYRKSGVVQIGVDINDSVTKGLSGPTDQITGGYTNQMTLNGERQRQAYEDSKINHMLNAIGVVTGQMMSAEVDPDPAILGYMKEGMRNLLTPNSNTPIPFG